MDISGKVQDLQSAVALLLLHLKSDACDLQSETYQKIMAEDSDPLAGPDLPILYYRNETEPLRDSPFF